MTTTRLPYPGSFRKLVLAFDIGTEYSRVSYVLLDPGSVPEIKSVGMFLNSRSIGSFRTPSTLFYDHDGNFRGVEGALDDEEAEGLHEVRWWKLRLSPGELPVAAKKHMTVDLPSGKRLQDIFADFIRYLFVSATTFLQEYEPMGEEIWESFKRNINLILTHPNGWEGQEQRFLRESVVQASIFTKEEARSRVSFVTEGEAILNFCMTNTESGALIEPGHKVLVVNAASGTIDISSYAVNSTSPLVVEEVREPKCSGQGAEFVTARARDYAKARFKNSIFDSEHDLAVFTESFDIGLRVVFSDSSKTQFVRFGSPQDNDARCGVKGGKLSLPGEWVAMFFQPSIDDIVNGIKEFTAGTDPANTFIFLTGVLGASPWVFQEVGREISIQGLKLLRPDAQTNEVVAIHAISFYLGHFVIDRVLRHTYGTLASVEYDHSDPEHRKRSHKKYLGITGEFQLDVFNPTLFKGTRVSGERKFRKKVSGTSPLPPVADKVLEFPVIRYTGTLKKPQWMDEEQGDFKTVSHISADVAKASCITGMSRIGFPSFIQEFEVVYTYSTTEFTVQLVWMEEDTEKCSDPVILCDDEGGA